MSGAESFVRAKLHRGVARPVWQDDWLVGHGTLTNFIYILVDAMAVFATGILSFVIAANGTAIGAQHRMTIMIAVLLTWIVFNAAGLNASWRGRDYLDHARATAFAWFTVVFLMVIASYLAGPKSPADRSWMIWWAVLGLATLVTIRLTTMAGLRRLRAKGVNHKRVVVVGGGHWGQEVISRIQQADWLGLDIVAVVDQHIEADGRRIAGVPLRGDFATLLSVISKERIDEVWICLPLGSRRAGGRDWIGEVMSILNDSTVTQRLLPEIEEMRLLNRPVTEIIGLPVVNLNTSPLHGSGRIFKRMVDVVLSLAILILISPVMLIIAVAIKLDSKGPVLFKQLRHGSDGRSFKMLKFRTMKQHSEEEGSVTQATVRDSRVTRVGAFLRRNSLDELPQFINVLQGNMSVVGPRPHAVEHNEYYRTQIDSYMQRHRVKPGITGWAQVNGFRGATEDIEKMRQRVNYDLYYIEHWSLWIDIKIIFRTFIHGFRGENAY